MTADEGQYFKEWKFRIVVCSNLKVNERSNFKMPILSESLKVETKIENTRCEDKFIISDWSNFGNANIKTVYIFKFV